MNDGGDANDDVESVISTTATVLELPESCVGEAREPLEGMSKDAEDYTEWMDVHARDEVTEAPKKKIFRNGVEVEK